MVLILTHVSSCVLVLLLSAAVSAFIIEKDSFTFYPREAWGALPPTDVTPLNTPVPYVVIHHTYIPAACYTFERCSSDMRSMQRTHMGLNWGDIGYNFCIGAEGSVYEGRGWKTRGVHAAHANGFSVGICLIGDWRVELPPQVTLEATKALIEKGLELGIISPDYKLIGHQQVTPTECPGQALLSEIETWPHYQRGNINFTLHHE